MGLRRTTRSDFGVPSRTVFILVTAQPPGQRRGEPGLRGRIFLQVLCADCRALGILRPRSSDTENVEIAILWLSAKQNRIFRACQVPGLPTNSRAEDLYSPQEKPSSGWGTQTPQGGVSASQVGGAELPHRVTQSGAAGGRGALAPRWVSGKAPGTPAGWGRGRATHLGPSHSQVGSRTPPAHATGTRVSRMRQRGRSPGL